MSVIDNSRSQQPCSCNLCLALLGIIGDDTMIPVHNIKQGMAPYGDLQAIRLPGPLSVPQHAQVFEPFTLQRTVRAES
jgi:hypothetical protein